MIIFSRKVNSISYLNKLLNDINIPWSEEAHKTYVSATDKVSDSRYSFNLLGFIDIFIYIMFSGYLYIDNDREGGNSRVSVTLTDGETANDIKGLINIIENSTDCIIYCGGK